MLEIGSLVDGKYKILSQIGQGGMSVVYMAINEKANKTWAVKEVRKDGMLNFEAVRQGLVVETDMLKRLKHPNLPSIIDIIEDDQSFLIVMDYIEGNSLKHALAEYGAQSQKDVIKWAKQLCGVLGYLHSQNPAIIYRDMKPGNIMLKPDGNVTLIDFGTAREFKAKNLEDTTCLGTVGYAAPEQFGGMGQTDARTDIYCLGATMYHLVTGYDPSRPPYEIKPIRMIDAGLSSGLEEIIVKCTRRNPDERFQSAYELEYALDHYEEIDDNYKRKQKRKLGAFISVALLTILIAAGGLSFHLMAVKQASDTYESKISDAAQTSVYEDKIRLYEEAIGVPDKAGVKDAYLGLIQAYRENDSKFDSKEAAQLEKLIRANRNELLKNSSDYAELCFSVGKMFWYYYEDMDGLTPFSYSKEWFKIVIDESSIAAVDVQMANIYYNIADFYLNIQADIKEANDDGKYRVLFDNLTGLVNGVALDENESEIVKLELIELTRNSIRQYASKFKKDGINEKELQSLFSDIENMLDYIEVPAEDTEDVRTKEKNEIQTKMNDTKAAIDTAYGTDKGG